MRIVHNYNLRYHKEKALCTSYHKLIVVGNCYCSHDIQDKVCWQCLFRFMKWQHCWSSFPF